jgi:hypothetical protein
MRPPSLFALAVFATAPLGAEIPQAVDKAAIPNYRVIRPGLAAAGQPSTEALGRLKEMGFKTVINLRTEKEGGKSEEGPVKAAGLRYVWVPVTADTFSAADVDAADPPSLLERKPGGSGLDGPAGPEGQDPRGGGIRGPSDWPREPGHAGSRPARPRTRPTLKDFLLHPLPGPRHECLFTA